MKTLNGNDEFLKFDQTTIVSLTFEEITRHAKSRDPFLIVLVWF